MYFMFTADMAFALTFDVIGTDCMDELQINGTWTMCFQQRAYLIANTACDIKAIRNKRNV